MPLASAAGCRKMTKSSRSGSGFTSFSSLTCNSDARYLEFSEKRPNLSLPSGIFVNVAQILHLAFFSGHIPVPNSALVATKLASWCMLRWVVF